MDDSTTYTGGWWLSRLKSRLPPITKRWLSSSRQDLAFLIGPKSEKELPLLILANQSAALSRDHQKIIFAV